MMSHAIKFHLPGICLCQRKLESGMRGAARILDVNRPLINPVTLADLR